MGSLKEGGGGGERGGSLEGRERGGSLEGREGEGEGREPEVDIVDTFFVVLLHFQQIKSTSVAENMGSHAKKNTFLMDFPLEKLSPPPPLK